MIKIPQKIEYILKTLSQNGFKAYIVGGCVRDALLGKTPTDYDVTTNAKPQEIIKIFEKTVPTGIKHGTVTVIENDLAVEVTTFRTEGIYNDNRHPENVEFVTDISLDLSRRDFTVNAMAYNNDEGLIDFYGGKSDLENKLLRAVGNADNRFNEDALRILRLFRFSSTLNFEIEEKTFDSAITLCNKLQNISRERISAELFTAVCGPNFKTFEPLIKAGAFNFLGISKACDFEIVSRCRNSKLLAFFAFFYLSGCNLNEICNALKLSNQTKNYFNKMLSLVNSPFPETKGQIKHLLNIASPDIFSDFISFKEACGFKIETTRQLLNEILKNNEPFLTSHLKISGEELKCLGFKGEKIGDILEKLKAEVIKNPQNNNLEFLMQFAKKL